jgi:hypothetical protein
MNAILFATGAGSPIAVLLMSTPAEPVRDGVFNVVAYEPEAFESREGQVIGQGNGQAILPDRPAEYACCYSESGQGVSVAFENQDGWRFWVSLDNRRHGGWAAEKNGERLTGRALAL